METEQPKQEETSKEEVLGLVYNKEGVIGFTFTESANESEVLYFLETFCKLKREEYKSRFVVPVEDVKHE